MTKHLSEREKCLDRLIQRRSEILQLLQETLPASAQWKTYDNFFDKTG